MGYIRNVCSGGQSCAVLADQNIMGFISAIHELASRERQFYCWLSSVRKLLLTPLRNRGEWVLAPLLLTFAVLNVTLQCSPTYLWNYTCMIWTSKVWQEQMHQLNVCVFGCVYLCTLLRRECVSIIRWALLSSLLFSLWESCSSERPDRSTLHVTYLLPAWCSGPWCHFPSPSDAHWALSGHL